MRIVLAPDSFKGSLTAKAACAAMARAVKTVWPQATIVAVPMADGGDGTTEALIAATNGRAAAEEVMGPLPGTKVLANYGMLGGGKKAIVEMARASGLVLVPAERRNPLHTTTFGTGQLMSAALRAGVEKLIVGIGGSATTDCGAGMAQALGVRFLDKAGDEITAALTGGKLEGVADLDMGGLLEAVRCCKIQVACDVDNPLLGPRGAAAIYGSQKGASPPDVARLEANLAHFIDVVEKKIGRRVRDVAGTARRAGWARGCWPFATGNWCAAWIW